MNAKYNLKSLGLCLALVVIAAACSSDSVQATEADQSSTTAIETTSPPAPETTSSPTTETSSAATAESANTSPAGATILATGEFELPAVTSQEAEGYHQALAATHNLPTDLGPTAGSMLVIRIWDAGRPEQTCSEDHPISGCATVDWGAAIDRPSVPPGGVFDNSITFELATGERSFYLSEFEGALNDEPDSLEPST